MNGKLGKKSAIYGTILTASLALLVGQAIVRRSAPRRPAAPAPRTSPDPLATPSSGEEAFTHGEVASTGDEEIIDDERVEALESSIETLQSLLPADRSMELEQIGRAWAIERREPEQRAAESEAPPPPAPRIEDAAALTAGHGELLGADALAEFLTSHPLTAIAITPDGRLAAIGGELYAVGDELPGGLGSIAAIHARAISVACGGSERRVALGPLALRPRQAAAAPQAAPQAAPSVPPLNPMNATAPGVPPAATGAPLPTGTSHGGTSHGGTSPGGAPAAASKPADPTNAPAAEAPKSKS